MRKGGGSDYVRRARTTTCPAEKLLKIEGQIDASTNDDGDSVDDEAPERVGPNASVHEPSGIQY